MTLRTPAIGPQLTAVGFRNPTSCCGLVVLVNETAKTSLGVGRPLQRLWPWSPDPPLIALDGLDAAGGEDVVEGRSELAGAVANEELRRRRRT